MNVHELELCDIKKIAFEILLHFKSFCDDNNIQYFLSNGTLLGAIKYKGYIPWDDDIDVIVLREDYDRLIKIYKDNEKFKLISSERNSEYKYTFAKLCDTSTYKIEDNVDNGLELGIDIDIFPLDSCDEHVLNKSVINKFKFIQRACVLSKLKSSHGKPIYKRWIINYCRHKGYRYFENKMMQLVNQETKYGRRYKGCLVWPIYGEREILDAEVFKDKIEVEFEGERFFAPIGYDTYLRSLYGDYTKEPKLEKQRTHHRFKAYRIDEI